MGLAGNLTGTTIAIVVLVIILLLGYSILQKLNQTQQQVSNVAALQQSFQSQLATVVSSTLSPAEFILETNQWLSLIMTLGVLFGTELGQKLRNMVEEAEKRQKAREDGKARAEDGDTKRAINEQRPASEDLGEKVKKLQDESELKIRKRADADGRSGDLDIKDRQRLRVDPFDLDERIRKARETSEKVVRDRAHLDEIVRDNDTKARSKIRPTEDEIKDRVRKTQDASEKFVRSQAELDALTGDLENKKFLSKLETDAEYIKKKVAEARDVSERKVRADVELDAALRDTNVDTLKKQLVLDADDVKTRVKENQDGSERRVVAGAEVDAVRTDTRTGDFTSRLVADADDLKTRVKRLQDAAETKVRADAEFDARVRQVGVTDFTGRLIADSDALKARIAEARDVSERKVRADAELNAALKDTRAGDLTGRLVADADDVKSRVKKNQDGSERRVVAGAEADAVRTDTRATDFTSRLVTDADDLKTRVKRLQDAAETKVRADAEFDARVRQVGVTDFTGRVVPDSDTLKRKVTEARDASERKVRADAQLDAAIKDTRTGDFTSRLVADADDIGKRVKRLQDAAETKVRADAEFDARVKQVGAADFTGRLVADSDAIKARITEARDASERKVRVDAELDAALRDTRATDLTGRLVTDADDMKKRVKRLQDAAETKVRADAEFNARVNQVGSTDLTGRLIVDADDVKSRVAKARDASERKVVADAEMDAAIRDTNIDAIKSRLVTDADDLKTRVKRLQDAAETKVRADADFNARVNQVGATDLTGRIVPDSDTLKRKVTDARDASERKVRADAQLDAALKDTRTGDFTSRLVADADEIGKRVKRLQDAAETKIRADAEFNTRTGQTGAADLTGRLIADSDAIKARIAEARDVSERKVRADTELDAARTDTRVSDASRLVADADDLKTRVKRLQDAAETKIRTDAEFSARVNEVGAADFTGRLAANADELETRVKRARDLSERLVTAQAERDAARVDVDIKTNVKIPADVDDLKNRVKFFQEKNEKVLRIQQELDAEFQYKGQIDVEDLGTRFKNMMKTLERRIISRLQPDLTIADIKAKYRKKFARFPQTMDVIMTQAAEEGGRPRPRTLDGVEFVSTKELSEGYMPAPENGIAYTPDEQARLNMITSHALRDVDVDTRFLSAFGRSLSYPFRKTAQGARVTAAFYKAAVKYIKDSAPAKIASVVGDAMITSKVGKGLISTVDVVAGPGLDLLQIAMTFSDSAFAGIFPDESTIITAKTLKNIISKGVTIQLDAFAKYNVGAKDANNNHADPNYPYSYAQYPAIAGPLSALGMEGDAEHPRFKGDPYYNQLRIQTAVDAIREKILRDPNETFMGVSFQTKMITKLTLTQYNTIINSSDDSLVSYTDNVFGEGEEGGKFMDELYFRAYSNVCSFYGGKVYEDNYAIGPRDFTAFCPADGSVPGCSITSNRRRFQCGFATQLACTMYANKWLGQDEKGGQPIFGSYAEWFTATDINEFVLKDENGAARVDKSDPDNQSRILNVQPAFMSGACIVTTSGTASLCRQGKGAYDPGTHTCGFTPEFCQSIGTCYCSQDNGSCFLPNNTMEALSFFFGTGGPREWIKINGCRSSTCNPNSPIEYSQLATNGGEQWFADMFANSRNWGPELQKTLGNPTGAMMFAGAVLGLGAAAAESAVISAVLSAAMASSISGFAAAAGAEVGSAATAAAVATAASAASTMAAALGPAAILVAIGAGIAMMVDMGQAKYEQLTNPTIDEAEYTLGGWTTVTRPDGTQYVSPKRVSFAKGWVTLPIKYHPVGQITKPYDSVESFGFVGPSGTAWMRFFDTTFNWSQLGCIMDHGENMRSCMKTGFSGNIGQRVCYQNWGNDGSNAQDPNKFTGPAKWIRAGSEGGTDRIWCIPPFPVNNGTNGTLLTTGLFDPLIGKAASITSTHLTNNTWTNGEDASYPLYPIASAKNGGWSPNTAKWYYQIVYDELDVCKSQYLWSTPYLQKYFSDMTITNMRKTCCNHSLLDDMTGKTVDPKCWGYMALKFQQWNFKPTTVIPPNVTPVKAPITNYTPVTSCAAGSYFERIQNKCLPCPTGMYSPAGSYTCFSCGANATLVGNTDCKCNYGGNVSRTVGGVTLCDPAPIVQQDPVSAQGAGSGGYASDVRLKKNMRKTGRFIKGFTEYTWEWNDEARRIGVLSHPTKGVIAQEVLNVYPEVVIKGSHGYHSIDYTALFMSKDVVTAAPAAVIVPGIVPDMVTVPGPMS